MQILLTVDPEIPVPPKLYGGIERIVDGLAEELRYRGHKVALLAHSDSECPVDRFFAWPGTQSTGAMNSTRNTLALLLATCEFQPDVLHSFSRLGYLLPVLTTPFAKVMSYQRHTGGARISFVGRLGGRRLAFTGCSEYIARRGRQFGGSWEAIPNFVDTDFYTSVPEVAPDAPLVFLSRVERIKGAHSAIAMARGAGRRLIIAGNRITEGEGHTYWDEEIAPHLGRDGIEYIGPVNDSEKNALLGTAAALIVPVEWGEPFGIVFAEALACGTPVISCPLGALPEIVVEGRHGFLVQNVEDGVAAITKLPTINRRECRQRAEQLFSRTVVTSQYEALYHRLQARA